MRRAMRFRFWLEIVMAAIIWRFVYDYVDREKLDRDSISRQP